MLLIPVKPFSQVQTYFFQFQIGKHILLFIWKKKNCHIFSNYSSKNVIHKLATERKTIEKKIFFGGGFLKFH